VAALGLKGVSRLTCLATFRTSLRFVAGTHEGDCGDGLVACMVRTEHGRHEKGVLLPVWLSHDAKNDFDDANQIERVTLIRPPSASEQSKTI
jgi:hypothetical protein